ncbi:MAG: ABC transporter ATP-binding protein [Rickettsiales endosymbiont of Dermacentor nuttalli]
MHYASVAYKERSLKNLLINLFNLKKRDVIIKDVHALKNISLKINEGDRVGILGHNGSGKSTLLKTIAGLYPISDGILNVKGTIRALLDLSLGFELEASGRENILYRGLLLGLKPDFIRQVEEEIIAFADIGDFIDYPIKVYSAGMQVRLAFSISTAIGGDILLLDEVIGAGDANFMVKAKNRIISLIEQSKILLLASHDISSLQSICNRGIVLHKGELVFDGNIDKAILQYHLINHLD